MTSESVSHLLMTALAPRRLVIHNALAPRPMFPPEPVPAGLPVGADAQSGWREDVDGWRRQPAEPVAAVASQPVVCRGRPADHPQGARSPGCSGKCGPAPAPGTAHAAQPLLLPSQQAPRHR